MSALHRGTTRGNSCRSAALYVHVPFCQARCTYCDFNTYAELGNLIPAYGRGLRREIEAAENRWGPMCVSTVYIGGGTPSLLPMDLLADLMNAVRGTFDVSQCVEITLEANPGTVTEAYLRGLRSLGVTRLSIGVQSAHDEELQMLGRIHGWSDAVRAVDWARASGFENLNLDLLFGLPGQALDGWRDTLEETLALDPEHLSLYGLSLEEGTPLAERIARGELAAADDDRAAAMYELAEEILAKAGFFHYEISNWARMDGESQSGDCRWWPGGKASDLARKRSEEVSPYVCRHNLTYWRNEPWLGVGAGAHSWATRELMRTASGCLEGSAQGQRWANVDHPEDYVAAADEATSPASLRRAVEKIGRQLEMGETMMLGLRLAEGVRAERFEARFGAELMDVFGEELTELRQLGLLAWDGGAVRLTRRGRLLGNRVFERFI